MPDGWLDRLYSRAARCMVLEKERERLCEQLRQAIEFIRGLQDMQAMPSKEFDDSVELFIKKVEDTINDSPFS